MRLYVGTNMERGLAIIKEGKIRCVVDRIHGDSYGDLATSDGFVYLTDKVPIAIYYGNKAQIGINPIAETGCFYIFEIEVDESQLLPDMDEINVESKWVPSIDLNHKFTAMESLALTCTVAIARDLMVPEDIIRFAVLPIYDRNKSHPFQEITNDCIHYRKGDQIPDSVAAIPWVDLPANFHKKGDSDC